MLGKMIYKLKNFGLTSEEREDERDLRVHHNELDDDDDGYYPDEDIPQKDPSYYKTFNPDNIKPFTKIRGDFKDRGHSIPFTERTEEYSRTKSTESGKGAGVTIHTTKPQSIDEVGVISDKLKEGCIMFVSLEGIKHDVAQRVVDCLAGVTHGINGSITNLSKDTFVIAPQGVTIGDNVESLYESASYLRTFRTGTTGR